MSYRGSKEFKYFIEDIKLLDVPNLGGRFTWFNGEGNAMIRHDRFLLSANLVSN